jgi:uncharacterized protein DUF4255
VATFRALAAVSRAILQLLEDSCPRGEFPDAQFALQQALDFQRTPIAEGVSLYLYRVAVNGTRRNLPPRTEADGRRFRPPIPLDVFYAVCAWGRTVDVQQRLLGYAIRTLEDTPILPASLLNQYGPEPSTFRPHETIELVCDPISLQDLDTLWDLLKPNVPLAITYVARMIAVESGIPLIEAREVQTRVFELVEGPS